MAAIAKNITFCVFPLLWSVSLGGSFSKTTIRGPKVDFYIRTTWHGEPVNHDPVKVTIGRINLTDTLVYVQAPYFHGPPAKENEDTESVQIYFLSAETQYYLLIELNPHSQYRAQLFRGLGQSIRENLPLQYVANIVGKYWHGEAHIPEDYYPPGVAKINIYAQHTVKGNITYEALYPVPKDLYRFPQIPKLEYFEYLPRELQGPGKLAPSAVWEEALQSNSASTSVTRLQTLLSTFFLFSAVACQA
ncbi:UPF0462 protein C4orf33 homolog [Ornithodoros turicata]|uniref:UPF0462 protein C4orf33 homolog n=1 Tax=Ornithodoros turicata TaxID=34597 RepID=UPI00313895E2